MTDVRLMRFGSVVSMNRPFTATLCPATSCPVALTDSEAVKSPRWN